MTPEQREAKRKYDRERKAAQRAAMTESQRRDARREHDAAYRKAHRYERQVYDRERRILIALGRWKRRDER